MTFTKQILFLLIFVLMASPLFAQQTDNQNQPLFPDETEFIIPDENAPVNQQENILIERNLNVFSIWDAIRMILILAFVIASIYGFFFIIRKAGVQKFREDDLINVISSKSVTAGKTLHIVEVGNHIMLLGAADNSISTLLEITDKETIDNIRLRKAETKRPAESSFQQYLYNMFFKEKGNKTKSSNSGWSFDYFKKQRDRIGKM
ncbi:MAG: flagellar biosynthetic protein FliO [Spirochaetes bacterium]|nr:flagellar biosynthetic protein FliO [Spirochaetota bacterium]